MAQIQSYHLVILLQIILMVIAVQCNRRTRFHSDFDAFKTRLYSIKNTDIHETISDTIFSNWTDNDVCSNEMVAIKHGLMNSEEWAYKSKLISFILINFVILPSDIAQYFDP